jgi:nicotinate-nucleotide adenylyltransferase
MLQLATADNANFNVSGIEAQRLEPSFTIDTLKILVPQFNEPTEIYFIIGVDAFLDIHTWKQYEKLPGLIHFVIISRPAYSPDNVGQVISKYFDEYVYEQDLEIWRSHHAEGNFILLHMDPVHLSSTHIRESVRTNKSISGMVPAPVEDYIEQQELYRVYDE